MRHSARVVLALLVAAIPVTTARAQTVTVGAPITTTSYVNSNYIQPSNSHMYSWGQTFATPDALATRLDSWTFWLDDYTQGSLVMGVTSQLQVFEWNNGFVGGPLYSSASVTPSIQDREPFTFNVGLDLDPSKMYIAFLNPTGTYGTDYGHDFAASGVWYTPDAYAQGNVWFFETRNPGSGYDDIHNNPYMQDYGGGAYDLNFEATFTATTTPEPATLSLMATGIMGLAGVVRRRRRVAD